MLAGLMRTAHALLADVFFRVIWWFEIFVVEHCALHCTTYITLVVQAVVVACTILSRCERAWDVVNLEGFDGISFLESCAAIACIPCSWTVGSSLIAATERLGLRSLRCRRGVQKKKHVSGTLKVARHRWQLNKRGVFFMTLLASGYGVQGMDQQQFAQFMEGFGKFIQRQQVLGQATTNLAGSIPEMLKEAVAGASSASSSAAGVAKGLELAARILKNPEYFDASDAGSWISWRHSFLNWLTYAESTFLQSIQQVEKLGTDDVVEDTGWSTSDWDLAYKLYAILTSYLKGPVLQISRGISESRNGLQLWKTLTDHFAPHTRQRALALSQAISSFPTFSTSGGKTLHEQIMNMELLVNQYDQLSTKQFDRDILLGVLLRACPDSVRQHLTLSVNEGTSYAEVKEKILAYERSSRFWTAGDVMKQLNDRPSTKTTDGPVAMEVDAVNRKVKVKAKARKVRAKTLHGAGRTGLVGVAGRKASRKVVE